MYVVTELHETAARPERAYLVGVRDEEVRIVEAESLLRELAGLTSTLGIETAGTMMVGLRARSAATLVGSGKVEEIVAAAKAEGADSIIFDKTLRPVQQRNWEKLSGSQVYDRSELIIDIFASRARTREATLQVELARLDIRFRASRTPTATSTASAAGATAPRARASRR